MQAMRRYTAVHLARIYPAGYRVDSSNYDPQDLQSPERFLALRVGSVFFLKQSTTCYFASPTQSNHMADLQQNGHR